MGKAEGRRRLMELLEERQEPFRLAVYLLENGCCAERIPSSETSTMSCSAIACRTLHRITSHILLPKKKKKQTEDRAERSSEREISGKSSTSSLQRSVSLSRERFLARRRRDDRRVSGSKNMKRADAFFLKSPVEEVCADELNLRLLELGEIIAAVGHAIFDDLAEDFVELWRNR